MKRRNLIFIAGTVIIAAAVVITFATDSGPKFNFRTIAVSRGNIDEVVTATGQLSALKTVQVGTQVSGTIMKLNSDFNSKVRKGEIIAVLDTNMLAATVADAAANLNHIKAQLIEAQNNYEQEKILFDKKLDSETNYYTALSDYKSLEAQKQQAEADLRKAKINLNYATIRAPINGIVISRNVDVGQTVAASLSAPTLFSIANNLKKMQVQADVDEADIGNIKVGQKVNFTVDTYPNETFHGVVSQVRLAPEEIQNVVNYTVIINVDNNQLKLMPGMTATVSINIARRDSVLELPDIAFYFQPSQNMIDQAYINNRKEKSRYNSRNGSGKMLSGKLYGNGMSNPKRFGSRLDRNRKTIWLLDKNYKLYPLRITAGLDDGTNTQIISSRIKPGEQVVIGTLSAKDKSGNGVNPFAPQRRFHRRGRQ